MLDRIRGGCARCLLAAFTMVAGLGASQARAQVGYFEPRPHCPPPPCPGEAPLIKDAPPPQAQAVLSPVTTAALTPAMFGDRFSGSQLEVAFAPSASIFVSPSFLYSSSSSSSDSSLLLPNPSQGVVGRARISEGNTPLPQDRLIFTYDYFNNANLTFNGWDVQRYSLGFEKTFFNQVMSLEVRLPFASTLDSDVVSGAENTNAELGNLRLTLRSLLYASDQLYLAGGLGVDVPTGDDMRLFLADNFLENGRELVRVENEAVILMPYLAAVVTPNDRLFMQAWLSMELDAVGNSVLVNDGRKFKNIGRLHDSPFLIAEAQIGYWLVQSSNTGGFLQGLAPFLELHYGTTVGDADFLDSSVLTIKNAANRIDELDLTAGIVMLLGDNINLSLGAVVPLRTDDSDKGFDFQFGFRFNWLFGPSTRVPRAVAAVN